MEIPQAVHDLLRVKVSSFEELEVLLLLRRRKDETWTRRLASEALGLDVDLVAEALEHLATAELLALSGAPPTYRYHPASPILDEAVTELERAYAASRIEVMRILNANALERVRTSALKMFANAFVLGGRTRRDG